ncbi:BNR-4 repeat-containing protein [Coraliomargarita akajimensis]|nr:BNR-4 repeat-containing protein [Coraliomargarita akajimensis]
MSQFPKLITWSLPLLVGASLQAAQVDLYVDANDSNTVAQAGTPNPFWTSSITADNLWRKRTGFGFDANGNTEIYEKDVPNGVGDAAPLVTTVSGLTPGQEYGVYACFISVPGESWRVRAGLAQDALIEFTPTSDADRVTDLGRTSVTNSNRNQYIGFIDNAVADTNGELLVYIDDGEGNGNSSRTWYEGVAVGDPYSLPEPPPLPGGAVEVAPDGVWTWFNDERAIWHLGYLYAGYVRSDGHVGLSRFDPATATSTHVQLSTSSSQQVDDHNNCSITVLPDDRLLVVYSKHNANWSFFSRISTTTTPASLADWGSEQVTSTPASNTYANTYRLSGESNKIYNFHRSINFNPTITTSSDNGVTWGTPTHFIDTGNNGSVRPYPRYCSNHTDRIDLIYTDGHPRAVANSVYHMYYEDGEFLKTDGSLIKSYANLPIDHDAGERGSVIYQYSTASWGVDDGPDDWIPYGRGWTWDVHYGHDGHPVCVFQVQSDNVTGSGWTHDRIYYYYARWTGTEWQKRFIAQAGRPIYSNERDYGGGMTIDPEDPRVVYISSNALSPFDLSSTTAVPLNTDSRYELYRGFTADGGLTFEWTAVTEDSVADNLRPVVPEGHGRTRNLVWFYGTYTTYVNYDCQVLSLIDEEVESLSQWQLDNGITDAMLLLDSDQGGSQDLVEYALGGNPNSSIDEPRPLFSDHTFSFSHNPLRTGVESIIQYTTNLSSGIWHEAAIIRAGELPHTVANGFTLLSDGGDPEQLSIEFPPASFGDQLFVNLLVREL